jgi:hypothetical protein
MNAAESQKWLYPLWTFPAWHFLLFGSALFWVDIPVFQTFAHLIALLLPVGLAMILFDRIPRLIKVNKKLFQFPDFQKRSTTAIYLIIFVLLSVVKWFMLDDFQYEARLTGFSSYLFALNYSSWFLLGFALVTVLKLMNKSFIYLTLGAIMIELFFIFITGVRQDLLLFVFLLFLIVLFVTPQLFTFKRISIASVSIFVLLLLMFFSRTQRVDPDVTFQNELTQLSSYISKSAERLYAEPIAFSKVTSMTPDQVEFMPTEHFFAILKTAFIPRFLDKTKPELRPGNEFYQCYFSQEDGKSHISYPTGIFTDTYRVWGDWSPLATFVCSVVGVLFWWIIIQSGIPVWLGSFIFISELAIGNHIPFWFTGWLRMLILALMVLSVLVFIQKIIESILCTQKKS